MNEGQQDGSVTQNTCCHSWPELCPMSSHGRRDLPPERSPLSLCAASCMLSPIDMHWINTYMHKFIYAHVNVYIALKSTENVGIWIGSLVHKLLGLYGERDFIIISKNLSLYSTRRRSTKTCLWQSTRTFCMFIVLTSSVFSHLADANIYWGITLKRRVRGKVGQRERQLDSTCGLHSFTYSILPIRKLKHTARP